VAFAVLYHRARQLESDWGLPARRWVSGLRSANGLTGRLLL
jgi:hypothetical protein